MLKSPVIGGMNMRGLIFSAALAAAALGGCYVADSPGYGPTYGGQATVTASGGAYAGDGYAASPDLVSVSPGVQVVADYDEPVFYNEGFYWRYYDGGWYRSNNYATGWYFVSSPPIVIARIDRPYAYAHYRPAGYAGRRTVRYRPAETIVRGRAYQSAPAARGSAYVGPATRDYRGAPPAAAPPGRGAPPAAAPPGRGAPPPAAPPPGRRAPAPRGETRDHRH
jgi:hypothetical protein